MIRFLVLRSVQAIVSLIVVSLVVFGLLHLSGDPLQVLLPEEATRQQYELMAKELHLDDPFLVQYWIWAKKAVRFDFGESNVLAISAGEAVKGRLPATVQLAASAFAITLLVGVSVGVYSAAFRGSKLDIVARSFAILGQAIPNFWLGIMLILVISVHFDWLPAGGKTGWNSLILPAFTLGLAPVAGVLRLTRSSMIEVLSAEYVKMARAKGVRETMVVWRHAFKNAALPVLTFGALIFMFLLRGSLITETVFAWPGVGSLVIQAVMNRDFPIVQATVMMFSAMFILGNLFVDVLYGYLNPRIRVG